MRDDELIERAIDVLREPVRIDPDLDRRVMAEIATVPAPRDVPAPVTPWEWLVRRRTFQLRPLTGLAAAAGLVLTTLIGRGLLAPGTIARVPVVATAAPAAPAPTTVQFVALAPNASSVVLVGDFNDWDAEATPMRPVPGDGLWSVTVPLAPGRYRYSFLVDGSLWVADPAQPRALDDDFGRPNSVVTVGGT